MSAQKEVSKYIKDPLLRDMLFAPLMYYGNPEEHDMDFTQFAIMWKSIYQTGFARPSLGMKHVIGLLLKRYKESGGELRLNSKVTKLYIANKEVQSIELSSGEEIIAEKALSSAGYFETLNLCSEKPAISNSNKIGRLSFVELVAVLDESPAKLGIDHSIIFFNNSDRFIYRKPETPIDLSSGVICIPGNFNYVDPPENEMIRVTVKASYPKWKETEDSPEAYKSLKKEAENQIIEEACKYIPDFRKNIIFTDFFTPLTITRFTHHLGGAVYGSPQKQRKGLTQFNNLFLCGTDQGFLGIVGSMLSGISMANLHCLQ
jgi:phytoene dehydrogenase-like protein